MKASFLLILLLISCGKESVSQKDSPHPSELQAKEVDGVYQGILTPLNPVIDGTLSGAVNVARERDEFVIDVYYTNGRPGVFHPQNIHIGKRCPVEKDDLNKDGFIDVDEAFKVVGEIIIPIDDDISSQWMGLGTYPITDDFGSYYWAKATSYQKLLKDLHEEDINNNDDMIKISKHLPLSLEGNAVLILGAHADEDIPYTVSGRKHLSRHQALPVACAILKATNAVPGKIDRDDPFNI